MSDCRKFYLICFRYVDFFSLYYFQVKTLESKVKNTIYFLVQYMLQCNIGMAKTNVKFRIYYAELCV